MSTVAEKRMVNSRVDAQALERAKQVLSRQGLTISEFVRYSIEYVSQTNTVPESGAHPIDTADGATDVDAILDWLETQPMPGKADFEGLTDISASFVLSKIAFKSARSASTVTF